ncbi:MAG: AzlC family ABC transporter permease [Desulfosalsimonadaceae bacterium]
MRKNESIEQINTDDASGAIRQGVAASWPICLGYIPIGMAFGVLARQNGLEWWAVGLMSALVFAGSAQFIAVAMIASGAAAPAIIATTFFVNLRHTLMSSVLAVCLSGVSRWFLALFAYGITDESFAVNMSRFRGGHWDRWRALLVNQLSNATWICATMAGAMAGQFVPPGAFGIDYALTGMFICLLVIQVYGMIYVITALIAAGISVAWYIAIPGASYIVGASLCAASIGFLLRRTMRRAE